MALPFVLGLVVGAGAVIAFNNSDKIKKGANELLDKSKDFAHDSLQKGKHSVEEVKETLHATAQCIKEKKESASKIEEKLEEKLKEA